MLTRAQKEEIVKNLAEQIKTGKVAVFSDFSGTSVGNMQKLRRDLRGAGATYKVTKKKLFDIAFKSAGIEISTADLDGQIGLAIGQTDEVGAPKILARFARENRNFKILNGVLEKKAISEKDILALATIPSREELLAKFVGSINAPVSGFVNALAGNLRNLVGVLKSIADTK